MPSGSLSSWPCPPSLWAARGRGLTPPGARGEHAAVSPGRPGPRPHTVRAPRAWLSKLEGNSRLTGNFSRVYDPAPAWGPSKEEAPRPRRSRTSPPPACHIL